MFPHSDNDQISIQIVSSSDNHPSSFADKLKIYKLSPITQNECIEIKIMNKSDLKTAIDKPILDEDIEILLVKKIYRNSNDENGIENFPTMTRKSSRLRKTSSRILNSWMKNEKCHPKNRLKLSDQSCDTIIIGANFRDELFTKNNSNNKLDGRKFRQLTKNLNYVHCQICKKKIQCKNEKIYTHYRMVHNFVLMKNNDNDLIITRSQKHFNENYFNFCCRLCLKKFSNFKLFQEHLCKILNPNYECNNTDDDDEIVDHIENDCYTKSTANIPTRNDMIIDYNSEYEFFKNLGLKKK